MKNLNLVLIALFAIFFAACKKSSNDKNTPGNTTVASTYYIKGTFNGQPLSWPAGPEGTPAYGTGSASTESNDKGVITGGLTATISALNNDYVPQFGVEFKTLQVNYDQDFSAYFKTFVKTGTLPFATSGSYVANTKSIVIYYTDSKGNQYSSAGAQTGSVNIETVTYNPAQLGGNETLTIKLAFSCTLYPQSGSGGTLSLTNAETTVALSNLIEY